MDVTAFGFEAKDLPPAFSRQGGSPWEGRATAIYRSVRWRFRSPTVTIHMSENVDGADVGGLTMKYTVPIIVY